MSQPAIIRRARFAGGGDAGAARRRLERRLGAADWSVPGLPPAAILCVRRLVAAAHVPGGVAAVLAESARRAIRPAREFVPAAADAVWFADEAEWLACLARDALAGELAARWWWQAIRRDGSGVPSVVREWVAKPTFIPAAWELLTGWGLAVAFAEALDTREAESVTSATDAAFGLPGRNSVPTPNGPLPSRFVPEAAALRPGLQRLALTVGLLLARAPHLARAWAVFGPDSIPRIVEVRPQTESNHGREVPETRPPSGEDSIRLDEPGEVVPDPLSVDTVSPTQQLPPSGVESETAGELEYPRDWHPLDAPATGKPVVRTPQTGGVETSSPQTIGIRADERAAVPVPVGIDPSDPTPAPSAPERVETAFGGLLYLVNVAQSLDLYPDFTEPANPGIALPLWDWLALLGRRWAGEDFGADPLDGLFAGLARREVDTAPGTGLEPPVDWRIPKAWEPWSDAPQPRAWASLADWLDWLAPVVERRLAETLDRPDLANAARWLIRRRASVFVAPAHLDVVLALDGLAVEVRAALLDRDPGWVPSAGTTIRFHYDSQGHRR